MTWQSWRTINYEGGRPVSRADPHYRCSQRTWRDTGHKAPLCPVSRCGSGYGYEGVKVAGKRRRGRIGLLHCYSGSNATAMSYPPPSTPGTGGSNVF
jgi:hypothetical protein